LKNERVSNHAARALMAKKQTLEFGSTFVFQYGFISLQKMDHLYEELMVHLEQENVTWVTELGTGVMMTVDPAVAGEMRMVWGEVETL
jgi:hypothetical protein